MKIADIMTPRPHSLAPDADVCEALALLAEHGIRHLPVVHGGRVVGVVSDRDLLGAPRRDGGELRLRDVMRSQAVTAHPDDTLVMASVEMGVRRVGCLPVIDGDGLVGIVTEVDLMRAFVRASRGGLLSGDHDPRVGDQMTPEPRTIGTGDRLEQAIALARSQHFRHLPVVDADGRIQGIVSDRDLCRALGRRSPLDAPVERFMTPDPVTIAPERRLSEAADAMIAHRISGLPVVAGDGALVGIVSSSDLVGHCLETLWEPEDGPA